MSTQTDAPALVRDLRQAARKREALADAYVRRADHYRAEAAEMRAAAEQVRRRAKRAATHQRPGGDDRRSAAIAESTGQ